MKRLLLILSIVPSVSFGQLIISGGATGGGSGDALTSGTLAQFAATTSSQFKGVISDENAPDGASSKVIMALGSLSVASGKTGTFSNSLTLTGTDASSVAFGAGGTVAYVGPRVASTTSSATPTPNADTTDLYILTALTDATATFGAPTGTPAAGQKLLVRITDSGGPRTLAWNSGTGGYSASTDLALPLTTTASKTMYLMFVYNATGTAKWNLLAKLDNF